MTCFERAPANKKRLTLIAVFVMLFASVLQSGTDSVILALAAAEIGGTEYYALAKSFSSVSAAVLMPMFAYLGAKDPSRKRSLFIWSALAGAVCIFLRAIATHMAIIVAAGILHGMFSSGLYVIGYSIIRDIYDQKTAAKYLGFVVTMNSLGTLIGPIVSGVMIDMLGWRLVCHIIWIIALVSALLGMAGVKVTKEDAAELAVETGSFDLSGTISLSVFLGAISLFLALGSSLIPFGSTTSNILLVVSLVGLVGLILTIRKKGNNCIIPVPVLKDRNTLILTINSFLMNFSLIAIFFFIPSYILYVLNGSATQSGLTTTLLSIPGLFMGPIYSRMIANKGSARGVLTIGMILRVVVHAAFIFILSPSTDLMVIYALMIIAGFYQSAHVCTMTTAPQIQLAADKRTYGNAMIQVTMALGSSIGSAVYSMVIAAKGIVDGLKVAFVIAMVAAIIVLVISQFLVKNEEN